MLIDIIRHGDCDDDAWLRGETDSELSALGWLQMKEQCQNLNDINLIVSSSAKRCSQFVARQFHKHPNILVLDEWRERSFGVFDGLPFDVLQQQYTIELKRYCDEPFTYQIPNSESFADFKARIESAWLSLTQNNVDHILLVTHSGPMRLMLQTIFGFEDMKLFNIDISFATRIRIEVIATDDKSFYKVVEMTRPQENL